MGAIGPEECYQNGRGDESGSEKRAPTVAARIEVCDSDPSRDREGAILTGGRGWVCHRGTCVPRLADSARRYARPAETTSSMASPRDLNSVICAASCRPGLAPLATSPSSACKWSAA